jgi:flavoprotein hydroxylase
MPPFAVQGMCSGIRDAADLAWKLERVLAGAAREELLDTYQAERRPHAQQAVERSVALGRMICLTDPVAAAHRDAAMASRPGADTPQSGELAVEATEGGFYFRAADGTPGPGAGLPVPPAVLGAAYSHVGHHPVLLTLDDPAPLADADLLEGIARWELRLLRLRTDGGAAESALRAWLASLGATAALLRPDCRVYGLARTPTESATLLHAFTTHYAPTLQPAT